MEKNKIGNWYEKQQAGKNTEGGSVSTVDEKELQKALGDCAFGSSWMWSVAGALIAIPYGIRAKSLMPLVFFGTTGAMLDIIQGFAGCEKEREALRKFLQDKKASSTSLSSTPGASEQRGESSMSYPEGNKDSAPLLPEYSDPRGPQ